VTHLRSGRFAAFACSLVASALAALALVTPAHAIPAVYAGDPTDAAGRPRIILPGVPLIDWGPDARFGTSDDVVDTSIVGDVDLVVRTGGTFVPGSGVIPAPAASVAGAPQVVAGGLQFPSSGGEVPYDLIVSDGAPSPAAGHALPDPDLDGRGALVVAFADLDGDGFVGPTDDDAAGAADDAVEAQEAAMLVGRRLAVLQSGAASGGLGVSLGLPASAGGLGLVIAGGAVTGAVPPLYDDDGWISTLFPVLWPLDPGHIIGGGNPRPADPFGLVDIEVDYERVFRPAPRNPVLGTPFAIPLDGSSVTNDLVRAISGPAVAVAFARALDPATFVPDPSRSVLPLDESDGTRHVVEPVRSLSLVDDGPGGTASLLVFPADVLGNQADPPAAGAAIELQASANLRIVAPDADGDPRRETLAFTEAGFAEVVLDDAGATNDGGAQGQLVATLDGAAAGAVRVTLTPGTGGGTTGGIVRGSTVVKRARMPRKDALRVEAHLDASLAALAAASRDLTIALEDAAGAPFYTRTLPAGSLVPNRRATSFGYRDPASTGAGRIAQLMLVRAPMGAARTILRLRVTGLDLSAVDLASPSMGERIALGTDAFQATLACVANRAGNILTCKR